MWELGFLFVAAVAIGVVSALLGVGGGGFVVPLLVLGGFVGEMRLAVGTSIAAVAFTSLAGSAGYLRDGHVDLRVGATLMPMTVVGAYLGAVASDALPDEVLSIAFGVFLVYPGYKMAVDRESRGVDAVVEMDTRLRQVSTFLFGGVVGFSSGLFGIGGGSIMVPALALVLGMTITRAVATSLFAMFPGAVAASVEQWRQGNLVPEYALPLMAGIAAGAYLGPKAAERVPKSSVRRAFGALLLVLAVRMMARGLL